MNKLSNQEMKKIAKSTLALVLAGTFTFAPIAMAEENTTEYETVEMQTNESSDTSVSPEEVEEAKTQLDDLEETNPSLIPGDFFYFAKIALEKIQLALTFDNAKEAELLATFASERLSEASVLFADGKEQEALEVIETAVEYMENSQSIIDEETTNDETDSEDVDLEEGTEEGTVSDSDLEAEEDADSEEVTEEESTEDAEAPAEEGTEEEAKADDSYGEIENIIRQNIVALTAAMEKVQNPTAKAALKKNIEKTYAKMAAKLTKMEEKYGQDTEEEETTDTQEPADSDLVTVEPDLLPADEEIATEDEGTEETMPADDDTDVAPLAAKADKEMVKQEKKAEKAAIKQERKAAKQEAKEQRKSERQHGKKEDKGEKKGKEKH